MKKDNLKRAVAINAELEDLERQAGRSQRDFFVDTKEGGIYTKFFNQINLRAEIQGNIQRRISELEAELETL